MREIVFHYNAGFVTSVAQCQLKRCFYRVVVTDSLAAEHFDARHCWCAWRSPASLFCLMLSSIKPLLLQLCDGRSSRFCYWHGTSCSLWWSHTDINQNRERVRAPGTDHFHLQPVTVSDIPSLRCVLAFCIVATCNLSSIVLVIEASWVTVSLNSSAMLYAFAISCRPSLCYDWLILESVLLIQTLQLSFYWWQIFEDLALENSLHFFPFGLIQM